MSTFILHVHSQPCWSRKRCQVLFPGRFCICPCGERSPGSACLPRIPISLSPVHGRDPCHKTHPPAGSTASLALWFAVNRETFREGRGRGREEIKRALGISVFASWTQKLVLSHNNSDTAMRKEDNTLPWEWASRAERQDRDKHTQTHTTQGKSNMNKNCTYI